jgi:V/A-type H+-transporting ATPase subunit I
MAIVEMQKVAILAHKSLKEDLLEVLHKEGIVEISERKEPLNIDHTEVQYRAAELHFAINVLKEVASKETLAASAKSTTEEAITFATQHTDVRGIVNALHKLEEDDTEAERMLQELAAHQTALQPWLKSPYQLDVPTETETTVRILGSLPEVHEQVLQEKVKNEEMRAELMHIDADKGLVQIVAHVWKEDVERFELCATGLGWTNAELPFLASSASSAYEEAAVSIKKLIQRKETNRAARVKLSVELPNLLKTARFMHWLDEKQSVRESLGETESTITLLGWAPKKKVVLLQDRLQRVAPATAVLKVKPDEGEEIPVLLKNAKILTPFESVTNLYGLPLTHEMDPTRALSPFFILYFSLCLTDAGYGAVIAIIFGTFLWKSKKTIEEARLPWLLFFAGIVTFFVSIPFGGWFGFTPAQAPAIFTKETADGLLFRGQIWNLSAESGITFLQNLSLFLGVTHLFFGMYLAGAHKWIHGRKAQAFWQDFTSHILLGAVLFMVLAPEELKPIAQYTFYGVLATFIWGKGYGSPWFVRPLVGVLGLMNFVISFVSNSLSYLRILALGLVTGALAAAVNQVAVEMGKLFPIWIAIPVVILIFLIGHLVSIALNTLGSFIHSGRLQFIEFFSQFFEGGGRPFSPFKRTT